MPILFPFYDYWWLYGCFTLFILFLLVLDLGVFHRKAHAVTMKEAAGWSVVWVSLGLFFCWVLYSYALYKFPLDPAVLALPGTTPQAEAWRIAMEYLTGFVVEKSLAVDNIFVFVVVFNYFAIPPKYQHRVLFFGIIGALIFRILFISVGAVLIDYPLMVYLFGFFLMVTGVKILYSPDKPLDPGNNWIIKFLQKKLPVTTEIHDQHFFVRQGGSWLVTPLFLALIFIEICDIIFAVDSVPAIFAITREPLIVYTSNVFAILGLRAMYFLLADAVHRFTYLKYGLGVVLVFVGLKMVYLNEAFDGKFPISWSLAFISITILTSIGLSFIKEKNR